VSLLQDYPLRIGAEKRGPVPDQGMVYIVVIGRTLFPELVIAEKLMYNLERNLFIPKPIYVVRTKSLKLPLNPRKMPEK